MLKVVIADDKHVALYGLCNNINWERVNAEVVGLAFDGAEALKQVIEHNADVLITDIQMPVMDGLELCRLVSEKMPNTMKIVISSYDYFEYAQKAIDYNVKNYILKPIEEEKLLKIEQLILDANKPTPAIGSDEDDNLELGTSELDNASHVISSINEILKNEWNNPRLSVSYIAKKLNFSQNYIGRVYKNATEQKISDQILNIRINKAKKLLRETVMSIDEISNRVGYDNRRYFARLFKLTIGVTPVKYRNSEKGTK